MQSKGALFGIAIHSEVSLLSRCSDQGQNACFDWHGQSSPGLSQNLKFWIHHWECGLPPTARCAGFCASPIMIWRIFLHFLF